MSLRITSPPRHSSPRRSVYGAQQEGAAVEPDLYMSRLIKLIPAEAVAIYPMLHTRAKAVAGETKLEKSDISGQSNASVQNSEGVDVSATFEAGRQPANEITSQVSNVINQTADTASQVAENVTAQATDVVQSSWIVPAMAWMLLLIVILLRWQATRDVNGNPQWGAVAIAAISFFLWVPTLSDEAFGIIPLLSHLDLISWTPAIQKFIPEILLLLWTLLVPAFYKPEG